MPSYAYFKGKIIPLEQANVNVMTHCIHYGTAVFEGIRGNWNKKEKQTYIFRLKEHLERLANGCRVLHIKLPMSVDELCELAVKVVAKCQFEDDIYIRPLAYTSSENLGVRLHNIEHDFLMFAFPWGPYLDKDKVHCGISSWRRPEDNVNPPQVKSTGIYLNNALAKTQAINDGFDEAIMMAPNGFVSEGTGENLFLIKNGKIITPAPYNSILMGITRASVIELAKNELGLETEERSISRAELYFADECFLTGTAAHVTPVSRIDHRDVGNGEIGPITAKIQELYFKAIYGNLPKYKKWCTPVYKK
jgi:branched-chain amino acid aminotransferase